MKRDWIWGWAAALPSLIVAFLAIQSVGLYSENPSMAASLALALATTISIGVLWIKNRHSVLRIRQSGGGIELVVRPIAAFWRAITPFMVIVDTIILAFLVVKGPVFVQWGFALALGTFAAIWIETHCSLSKISQSDDDIDTLTRRIGAVDSFILIGTILLWNLVIEGRVVLHWGWGIVLIGLVAYLWSLQATAYKKPDDRTGSGRAVFMDPGSSPG